MFRSGGSTFFTSTSTLFHRKSRSAGDNELRGLPCRYGRLGHLTKQQWRSFKGIHGRAKLEKTQFFCSKSYHFTGRTGYYNSAFRPVLIVLRHGCVDVVPIQERANDQLLVPEDLQL
jgi:hypothetical protein